MADTSKMRDLDRRMAERRPGIRTIHDHSRDERGARPLEKPFLSPLGWLLAITLNIALVLLIGLGVLLAPPLLACREQSVRGFFAGDTFQACASRGIHARSQDIDGWLRSVILRSGRS